MVVAYLAISKAMYWLNIIGTAEGLDGVWSAVLERLIQRDIVIILFVICVYTFEYMFVMKQKKWSGNLAQVILIGVGYVMFIVILTTYVLVLNWVLMESFNLRDFFVGFLIGEFFAFTVSYFVIAGFIFVKESLKKKEVYSYALDIQSKDIKLEMLQELLDDGVLSKEEFEIQKGKLLIHTD